MEEFEIDDDLHPIDPPAKANVGATWNGRDGEKCPEPNCDGVKDHGGKHFAWMAD